VNLVGHVAVALDPAAPTPPSTDFLVGCMLPDLAAIARVRVSRPDGDLGRGVTYHHACDAVFHDSDWFRSVNRAVRDALVDRGVDHGPARACSHAGVEMVLDGQLVIEAPVEEQARIVLATVCAEAPQLGALAPPDRRDEWIERLQLIGSSIDPRRYRDPRFVAERLHRMTSGRRRIELRVEHVDVVARTLAEFQPSIADASTDVVARVRREVPIPHHPG
jgi:hypothetical protein